MKKAVGGNAAKLKATAIVIAERLREQAGPGSLSLFPYSKLKAMKAYKTDTGGWAFEIGRLLGNGPGLEIWLDRYTRHPSRKYYACFSSRKAAVIEELVAEGEKTWPVARFTEADMDDSAEKVMRSKLGRQNFNRPILENYTRTKHHFFGFYDASAKAVGDPDPGFVERAVGFYLDVILSSEIETHDGHQDFPRAEDRRMVAAHQKRERSRYLAAERKRRDNYRCVVCQMTFAETYGLELGTGFAEAHHTVPLGKLPDLQETRLEDLVTVCANCHRMLHRMNGGPKDVDVLRAAFSRNSKV